MAQNIDLLGAQYSDVPAVELPKVGGGTASFTDVTDTTAAASDVVQGKYFYTAAGVRTEGTNSGGIEDGHVYQDANGYIVLDDETGKVYQTVSKSYTPTESQQTESITPGTGYDALSQVNVTVGAISSSYVGSGITRRSSSDLTASGATVTAPAGYYATAASKSVASGSVSASASKGTVTNHSVSVTPTASVTAGYVSSGATGTAVTVSASELVSGTLSITSSGTKDVTNYASASVAAGGATASATKGTVSNHSVTVTPSVTTTAGYVTAGTESGTSVTVSASELVSGTKSITANDTGIDVTNYASVDVAVPSVSPTLITKSITENGTYNASSDNADGYSSVTVNVSGGGGGGLVYETGTWTPAEDIANTTLPFQQSHTVPPWFYMVSDATDTYSSATDSSYLVQYINYHQLFGASYSVNNTTSFEYGMAFTRFRSSSATSLSGGTIALTHPYTEDGSSSGYSRYWATSSYIRAYTNSASRYWRAGRTYKWVAVWAPTS